MLTKIIKVIIRCGLTAGLIYAIYKNYHWALILFLSLNAFGIEMLIVRINEINKDIENLKIDKEVRKN